MLSYSLNNKYGGVAEKELLNKFNKMLKKVINDPIESSEDDECMFRACTQKDLNNRFFNDVAGLQQVSINFIQYMVNNKVDPRSGIMEKDDAFVRVCEGGNLDKVKYFIDNFNSDINAKKGEPLLYAIRCNNYDVFKLLVKKGCNINKKHIKATLEDSKLEYVEFLKQNGYNSTVFVNELFRSMCERDMKGTKLLKLLASDADFYKIIESL